MSRAALVAAGIWMVLALPAAWGHALPGWVAVWRQLAQGTVFGWVVWRAVDGDGGVGGAVLEHPVIVYLGRISYGVYLVHPFAPLLLGVSLRAAGVEFIMPDIAPLRAACYWSPRSLRRR